MHLRYGINPHQQPASATPLDPAHEPIRVLHGTPSYLNILDAVSGWQLVRDAAAALDRPAAASIKHASPAGAAVAGPVDPVMVRTYRLASATVGPLTSAYVRARDADPRSSYGDLAAVSHPVDDELADLLRGLVCDGIVAPGYRPGTVGRLAAKKGGRFLVMAADPGFRPPPRETREIYGLRLVQPADDAPLTRELLAHPRLPAAAVDDLLLGLIVTRYTQSNSVAYVRGGMTLGIGAGQQSRVDCTRLAGAKVDTWWLRRHPRIVGLPADAGTTIQEHIGRALDAIEGPAVLGVRDRERWMRRLDGVAFASDGALPFVDNIEHASRHGVRYLAEPGGSIRSDEVRAEAERRGMVVVHTGVRLFRH